jgi:putative DNA primase/helicase
MISNTPCVIVAKGTNSDDDDKLFYKLLIKVGPHKEKTVWKSNTGLMTKSGVIELLNHDFQFQEVEFAKITGFFTSYLQSYKDYLPSEIVASRSGWKNNFAIFVMGNQLVSREGVTDIKQIDNPTAELYSSVGDASVWAEGVKYFLDFPQIRFKSYVSFSPIIIKLVMITNYIFDQCCGTTRLKSFSNELCASMFGHPKQLQLDTRSTEVGLVKMAEACNELPMFLDETSQNREFIFGLIYRFANANTRVKSNQSHGLEMSENFTTVVMATGEQGLVNENDKGGQDARRVPEKHGVPDDPNSPGKPFRVPTKIVNKANDVMYNNYGHVGVLFVQTLLEEIDTIKNTYNEFFDKFPEVDNIVHERIKRYYACILTAGYLLEKVFAKLGIPATDPVKICKIYYEENVLNGTIEPDCIKMLRIAYDLYVSDGAHFGKEDDSEELDEDEERKELLTKVGWIKRVKKETTINFRLEALKEHIAKTLKTKDSVSRFETASNEWRDMGILTTTKRKNQRTGKTEVLKTTTITVKGVKRNVLQIPLSKFYEHLGFEETTYPPVGTTYGNDSDGDEDGTVGALEQADFDTSAANIPVISASVPPSSGDGFNQIVSVTARLNENIIVHDGSSDLYNELMGDLGDDD